MCDKKCDSCGAAPQPPSVGEPIGYVLTWNGEVYYVTSNWEKQLILDTKEIGANAADIEFDEQTMTLFVPTFFGNQVAAYKLNN